MAEAHLKARPGWKSKPRPARSPGELSLDVLVHNVGAGHNIPSAVTELRRMWVEMEIRDAGGKVLFRNPGLDDHGNPAQGAIAFGAIAADRSRPADVQALGDGAVPLETDDTAEEFHPGHRPLQSTARDPGAADD